MMKVLDKMKAIRKDMRDNKGFTLVELIVVIVILAVLIGVSVSGYSKYIGQSKMNTDKNNAETVRAAIINAQAADGVYEELLGIKAGDPAVTVTMSNSGTTVSGSATKMVNAIKQAVDTTTLSTQTSGGTITLTAKVQGDAGDNGLSGNSQGSVTVSITAECTGNDVYANMFKGKAPAEGN